MNKKIAYAVNVTIAGLCGLTFGFTALGFFYTMISDKVVGSRDFVVYWATGQQLVHHANPYDRDALLKIEHSSGLSPKIGAMFMRNPPSTLPMVYPLGFLSGCGRRPRFFGRSPCLRAWWFRSISCG